MAGNNSIVKTGEVSIGVTKEEKEMLLMGVGMSAGQARAYTDYEEYKVSDANQPVVDGEHVGKAIVLPERGAKGPYDNISSSRINTTPKALEGVEE